MHSCLLQKLHVMITRLMLLQYTLLEMIITILHH